MQWDTAPNAGFSSAPTGALYAPVISDSEFGFTSVNVAAQESDPDSLLLWVRKVIAVRRQHPVFGRGTVEWLDPADPAVLAFQLHHEEQSVFVAANFADRPAEVILPAGFDAFTGDPIAGATMLTPYGSRWILLSSAMYHR